MSDAVGPAAGYCGVLQYPTELDDQLTLLNDSRLGIRVFAPLGGSRDPRTGSPFEFANAIPPILVGDARAARFPPGIPHACGLP